MTFNLEIANKNLAVYNPSLLDLQVVAHLTADKASGSSTLTVDNVYGFSVGQYILLGNFGEPTAEIIRIHASTPPSQPTITLASNTVFDHYTDTPVTVIDYNQVQFARSTTLAGSKSTLATQNINTNRLTSVYTDLTNTTGYGWARFYNSATSTYSDYSGGVPYTGNSYLTAQAVLDEACNLASVKLGEEYATEQELISDLNEAQDYIGQKADWAFELISDTTSIETSENQNSYSLSLLTYTPKFPMTFQGFLNCRFGNTILKYFSIDQIDAYYQFSAQSTLAATANVGDTSITLTDSNEFQDSGTVYLGSNSAFTYTDNDKDTGILSGIDSSSITVQVASGEPVWQGIQPGIPYGYGIFNNSIILTCPVIGTSAGIKLKVRYLKLMDRITDLSSSITVPFYNALQSYVAGKIEGRKRNFDAAAAQMKDCDNIINLNIDRYKLPTLQYTDYYNFTTIEDVQPENDRQWW